MFALKGVLLSFFGWLILTGSTDLTSTTSDSYVPEEYIVATEDQESVPLLFDAILEVNHASTYETPPIHVFSQHYNAKTQGSLPLFYALSYYRIGQQIVVNLTTKTIIFPFHCFT